MNKLLFFITLNLISFTLVAQSPSPEVISTAGNSYQSNSIQIDWTVGEVAITTLSNSNSMLTQGFHQPYYIITATNQLPKAISKINIYPNPTSNQINIDLVLDKRETIVLVLFDLAGKRIQESTYSGQKIKEEISLSNLPSGTYFLNIRIGNQAIYQTHKIQKIN